MWSPPWMSGSSFGATPADIASGEVIVYRGASDGQPEKIRAAPYYFATSETFSRVYGPTAAFRLKLKNPLIVDRGEWYQFANSRFIPMEAVVQKLADRSEQDGTVYDSVISDFGNIQVVFVLNAKKTAKLVK